MSPGEACAAAGTARIEEQDGPGYRGRESTLSRGGDGEAWAYRVGGRVRSEDGYVGADWLSSKAASGIAVEVVGIGGDRGGRPGGGIQVLGFSLRYKEVVRGRGIVLVGDGYRYRDLERARNALREGGHGDVWILWGGVHAWQQEAGAGMGDAEREWAVRGIRAWEFFGEREYEHWRVIDVSVRDGGENSPRFWGAEVVDGRLDANEFGNALRALADDGAEGDDRITLVVSEGGENYERVQAALRDRRVGEVFYLEGGMKAYREFVALQEAVARKGQRTSGAPRRCAGR